MMLRAMLSPTMKFPPPLPKPTASVSAGVRMVAWIRDVSLAETVTSPLCPETPLRTSESELRCASRSVAMRLSAMVAPTLCAVSLTVVCELSTWASMVAASVAVRATLPCADRVEPVTTAWTWTGVSSARLVPKSVSAALNRKFCGAMPIVLKASTTPTETPLEMVVASVVASMVDVSFAVTAMLPPAVVESALSVTVLLVLPRILLVAMAALIALDVPPASGLPPEEVT